MRSSHWFCSVLVGGHGTTSAASRGEKKVLYRKGDTGVKPVFFVYICRRIMTP